MRIPPAHLRARGGPEELEGRAARRHDLRARVRDRNQSVNAHIPHAQPHLGHGGEVLVAVGGTPGSAKLRVSVCNPDTTPEQDPPTTTTTTHTHTSHNIASHCAVTRRKCREERL